MREWLDMEGKTPEWLAEKLGRDRSTVRKWLRGAHRPGVSDLRAIEDLTGGKVTATDVLFRPEPKRRRGRPPRAKACAA